ncbi:MAG TPA: hypothetical protein DDY13_16365 [Cytophagales bacterium]|jgi:hypothetical protein|nr:hypothetical protein [Cytophagales bacterium]
MKKLIFALLMTVGTLSFASANVVSSDLPMTDESTICYSVGLVEFDASEADLEKLAKFEGEFGCADLYLGGTFVGWVCGDTVGDMIDTILEMFF